MTGAVLRMADRRLPPHPAQRTCPGCGASLPKGADICPNCGTTRPARAGFVWYDAAWTTVLPDRKHRQTVAAGTLRMVLLVLAKHADRDGCCYPGVPRMAALAALDDRSVRKALRILDAAGLVERKPRNGRTTVYRLISQPPTNLRGV